jgi:hypothetical protein
MWWCQNQRKTRAVTISFSIFLMFAITSPSMLYSGQVAFGEQAYHNKHSGVIVNSYGNWPYQEGNTSTHIVTFYPRELVLNSTGTPLVSVNIGFTPMVYHNLRVDDYATLVVSTLKQTRHDFDLVNTTERSIPVFQFINPIIPSLSTSRPNSAHQLVFTVGNNKTMVVYTEISDTFGHPFAYYATYNSPKSQYDYYLRDAQKIFNSFAIDQFEVNLKNACDLIEKKQTLNYIAGTQTVGPLIAASASIIC